uniref:Uncharacterized protein n=1 Tax=Yersinia enterocolitica W22703 TaxID=913028 RepID=F4MZ79_YEREN|nr:unknown protein [Yersinia enterocolitica W22703]
MQYTQVESNNTKHQIGFDCSKYIMKAFQDVFAKELSGAIVKG